MWIQSNALHNTYNTGHFTRLHVSENYNTDADNDDNLIFVEGTLYVDTINCILQ